jgi:hypothetical protein
LKGAAGVCGGCGGAILGVTVFNALFAIITIIIALVIGTKLWGKGAALAKPFDDRYADLSNKYKSAESSFNQASFTPANFKSEKVSLEGVKAEYELLDPMKAKRLAALNSSRRQKQLEHFLERFRLEDERVPMIGDKTKMILYTWGVLDASDVDAAKISAIRVSVLKKSKRLLNGAQRRSAFSDSTLRNQLIQEICRLWIRSFPKRRWL